MRLDGVCHCGEDRAASPGDMVAWAAERLLEIHRCPDDRAKRASCLATVDRLSVDARSYESLAARNGPGPFSRVAGFLRELQAAFNDVAIQLPALPAARRRHPRRPDRRESGLRPLSFNQLTDSSQECRPGGGRVETRPMATHGRPPLSFSSGRDDVDG